MKLDKWQIIGYHSVKLDGVTNIIIPDKKADELHDKMCELMNNKKIDVKFEFFLIYTCDIIRAIDKCLQISYLADEDIYVLFTISRNAHIIQRNYNNIDKNYLSLIFHLSGLVKKYDYLLVKLYGYKFYYSVVNILYEVGDKYEDRNSI